MFEKDAQYYALDEVMHKQEWYIKHPEHSIDCDYEDIKKHWGKGAEFGYNKANEWHKGSEHPNHNHEVLCILWGDTKEVGYCEHDIWHFEAFTADDEDVDYWKEIVLPELKESE